MHYRRVFVVFLTCVCVPAQSDPPKATVPPEMQAVLDGIRAASLRGDLSYHRFRRNWKGATRHPADWILRPIILRLSSSARGLGAGRRR